MAKKQTDKISQLREERNILLVSKENPKRLEEIKKKLDYFDYGIK